MKTFAFFILTLTSFVTSAQVKSGVYLFSKPSAEKVTVQHLFTGETRDFETITLEAISFAKKAKTSVRHADLETLLLIKEGEIEISNAKETKLLGPGSIALLVPGEKATIKTKKPAAYYSMTYRSKAAADPARPAEKGGSLIINWNDLTVKNHDKGSRRDYFDKATAMCKRMEMHVSMLNPGLKSHDPHTHRAAEIILMIKGLGEMLVGDHTENGNTGDLFFLESMVPHGIHNIDQQPITYFAFQFE